jgi:hypothetical protein
VLDINREGQHKYYGRADSVPRHGREGHQVSFQLECADCVWSMYEPNTYFHGSQVRVKDSDMGRIVERDSRRI